ncbi:uncharacterized protein PG998_007955 [Apiospora kogelbergensis]|uniref:Uncharacterized protein n=1 Tax=Apiospora kogelbergensis TaxID=1337665 RepID=A0AAW0QBT2_9PEZI
MKDTKPEPARLSRLLLGCTCGPGPVQQAQKDCADGGGVSISGVERRSSSGALGGIDAREVKGSLWLVARRCRRRRFESVLDTLITSTIGSNEIILASPGGALLVIETRPVVALRCSLYCCGTLGGEVSARDSTPSSVFDLCLTSAPGFSPE